VEKKIYLETPPPNFFSSFMFHSSPLRLEKPLRDIFGLFAFSEGCVWAQNIFIVISAFRNSHKKIAGNE